MANIYATTALKLSDTYVNTLPYGYCETAAATATKEVNVGDFCVETGAMLNVRFAYANTAANPTLLIKGSNVATGKDIYFGGKKVDSTFLVSNFVYTFIYVNSAWYAINSPYVIAGKKSDTTLGKNATAEGIENTASGDYSHAEGRLTTASGPQAHAEGYGTTASGYYSHAEGYSSNATSADWVNVQNRDTLLTDEINGWNTKKFSIAYGHYSHTEGSNNVASGNSSHAEGEQSIASGTASHAEGYFTKVIGNYSHAEGRATTVTGQYAHAEGFSAEACGQASHAEGRSTTAVETASHAEGYRTIAYGAHSHAEGSSTSLVDDAETADWFTKNFSCAFGKGSHVEGLDCLAYGDYSHAEGYKTKAYGRGSHAEGGYTSAGCSEDDEGNVVGYNHAEGYDNIAQAWQHVQGHYNRYEAGRGCSSGIGEKNFDTAFMLGNGTSGDVDDRSNAIRMTYAGYIYAKSSALSGADYAEYFEWLDQNPNNEDRRGYFVTMEEEKIKLANPGDYILGIVSGQPAVIGNGDEDWQGRYLIDEFGTTIKERFEYEEKVLNKTTKEEKTIKRVGTRYKQNPDYDPTKPYIQREDRPEWDAVGMVGVLAVRDDGTCQVNGFCTVAEGGIATASNDGYRVIKRVNDNVVKVVFR